MYLDVRNFVFRFALRHVNFQTNWDPQDVPVNNKKKMNNSNCGIT